jgi:hypothetical protein
MPLTLSAVEDMANLLLQQRGSERTVGKNWTYKFINRTKALKSKYNRKYDYQQALYKDLALIRE